MLITPSWRAVQDLLSLLHTFVLPCTATGTQMQCTVNKTVRMFMSKKRRNVYISR